jgi:hypothetical protein
MGSVTNEDRQMHDGFQRVKTLVDKRETVYTVGKWGGGVIVAAILSRAGAEH